MEAPLIKNSGFDLLLFRILRIKSLEGVGATSLDFH